MKFPNNLTPILYKLLHSFYTTWLQKSNHFFSKLIEFFIVTFSQSKEINNRIRVRFFFEKVFKFLLKVFGLFFRVIWSLFIKLLFHQRIFYFLDNIIFERSNFQSVTDVFKFTKLIFGIIRFYFTTFHNNTVFKDCIWSNFTILQNDRTQNLGVFSDGSV